MKINLLTLLAALSIYSQESAAFVNRATPRQAVSLASSTLSSPPKPRPPTPDDDDDDDKKDNTNNKKQARTTRSRSPTKSPSTNNPSSSSSSSFRDRLGNSGIASAAAMATAAVNAAVSMKSLEAPDVKKSYISMDRNITNAIDEEGLPLIYDKDLIEAYWSKERGALQQRWRVFAGKAVPFLTKMLTLFIRDGSIKEEEIPALSRQAREDLQDLGATFIKLGQMFSVRPGK